jgi:hypothetical protein
LREARHCQFVVYGDGCFIIYCVSGLYVRWN